MREPSHRLTQHKRRGGRSLLVLWDPEEAPTLFFKGSKPGAATAALEPFFVGGLVSDSPHPLGRSFTNELSVPDLLARYPRRPGAPLLQELLADDPGVRGAPINRIEDRFADLLDQHGVPRPRFNPHLSVAGRQFRPDCLWPQDKLLVELDGAAVHRTRKAFERDRERDRILLASGYRTMRVTWRQLEREPDSLITHLRRLLHNTHDASRSYLDLDASWVGHGDADRSALRCGI